MSYDEQLAARVRELVSGEPDLSEQRMFGGLAFLVAGNMAVAAIGQGGLMVRVDPEQLDAILAAGARAMEMRGREMRGWVVLDGNALRGQHELASWVELGIARARSLPGKP
ncbi:MAG: RNA methyltransferase [Dehalococcoidia bacterium]|nr:RNA methyltransferase [Dehalococcoidia bacterium]